MPTVSVMLAIHEKSPEPLDLYPPLHRFIVAAYSDRDAERVKDDLEIIQRLRFDVENPTSLSSDSLADRRDLFQSYYRALCALERRLPVSRNPYRNGSATAFSFAFTWQDAFTPSHRASMRNMHLEKAAILFNLGAVHSQMALWADRAEVAGLKQACSSFQAAAGAFASLRDKEAAEMSVEDVTVDLTPECAGMLENLMLAQAQECFFDMAVGNSKPPSLCSKIARQVALFYEETHAALNDPVLNRHFDRAWIHHVNLKAAQFNAEACYRYALHLHEKEEIPEEIRRLQSGIGCIAVAKRSAPKGVASQLLEAVDKLEAAMLRKLERAKVENDRVYLKRLPDVSALPALPAAKLAKSTAVDDVLDASKENLFSGLVPEKVAKALARYAESVNGIIRAHAEKMKKATESWKIKLEEMGLPDSLIALEAGIGGLPGMMKEDVEAISAGGGPATLEAGLQKLRDLKVVNQKLLEQVEELLRREEQEDSRFKTLFGSQWTRPESKVLTKDIKQRLDSLAGNLRLAADSDESTESMLKENSDLMGILASQPIESVLPSISRPLTSTDGNEDIFITVLKESLTQLESLGSQRASLEDMLKEMQRKDDILPKLMTTNGPFEDILNKELLKYEPVCTKIDKNINEQNILLFQIQIQNDDFVVAFGINNYKASVEESQQRIVDAASMFREIKEYINEGLQFYNSNLDALTNVRQQCDDFVKTRSKQCQEMIDVKKHQEPIEPVLEKLTSLNLASSDEQSNTPSQKLKSEHTKSSLPHASSASPRPQSYHAPSRSSINQSRTQPSSKTKHAQLA